MQTRAPRMERLHSRRRFQRTKQVSRDLIDDEDTIRRLPVGSQDTKRRGKQLINNRLFQR